MKLTVLTALLALFAFSTQSQAKTPPYQKGDVRLILSLPHVNYLSFNPAKAFRDAEVGFNGYGIGVERNYTATKFLALNTGFVVTFEFPFPVPLDAEYNKILSSFYVNLTDNFIKNRITFGYGLSYSVNTWREWIRDFNVINLPVTSGTTLTNNNLGLVLNTSYRFGKAFHLGLMYQPALLNLNGSPGAIYEHVLSLEAKWKVGLFSIKNRKHLSS